MIKRHKDHIARGSRNHLWRIFGCVSYKRACICVGTLFFLVLIVIASDIALGFHVISGDAIKSSAYIIDTQGYEIDMDPDNIKQIDRIVDAIQTIDGAYIHPWALSGETMALYKLVYDNTIPTLSEDLIPFLVEGMGVCVLDREGTIKFCRSDISLVGFHYTQGLLPVRVFCDDSSAYTFAYLGRQGEIEFKFDGTGIGRFSEGLARARRGGKSGYIDKRGNVAIPFQFERADAFSEGLAFAAETSQDGRIETGFINSEGGWVIDFGDGPILSAGEFGDGLAPVMSRNERGQRRWGYIDRDGNLAIDPIFADAKSFSNQRAFVKLDDSPFGKWGIIDTEGKWVVPPTYDSITRFIDGNAIVFEYQGFLGFVHNLFDLAHRLFETRNRF